MSDGGLPTRRFVTRRGRALDFTALGLGTAPLGNMHRALGVNEVTQTFDAAWDVGIRYFDTAPLYGHSLAELRLGRAIRGKPRDSYLLSTKVGRLLQPCAANETGSGIYKATPPLRVRFDYSYDGVMRSFEASLERLGVDRVEILFVHDVDARTHGGRAQSETRVLELIEQGGWRALDELRASGAVDAIGGGVNEWEPCTRLLELADPDLFLLAGRYTLLEQAPLDMLFPQCARRGVGIVIGGPFNSGVLAGKRSYDYDAVPPEIVARVRRLADACRQRDVRLPQAALQFPLGHPVVVSVAAGAQSAHEVRANAAMIARPAPAQLWDDLKRDALIPEHAPVPEAFAC